MNSRLLLVEKLLAKFKAVEAISQLIVFEIINMSTYALQFTLSQEKPKCGKIETSNSKRKFGNNAIYNDR